MADRSSPPRPPSRRRVVRGAIVAAVVTPFGRLGCRREADPGDRAIATPNPGARPSPLVAALLALGPWPTTDREVAVHWIERFVAQHSSRYEASAGALGSLVERFPPGALKLDRVALTDFSTAERDLLASLLEDIYSNAELRWYMDGVRPPGQCIGRDG